MTEWKTRRFWTEVDIEATEGGFLVMLDGAPAGTPAGNRLALPSNELADSVADEWRRQPADVDKELMPRTLLANTAIDRIPNSREDVVSSISRFAESDLLCHRAAGPAELAARQENGWGPVLVWARNRFGTELKTGAGVMPIHQDARTLELLRNEVRSRTRFELAALSEIVTLTGSLLLGLAVLHSRLQPEICWNLSIMDEIFQSELWGVDAEAAEVQHRRREAFLIACEFAALSGPDE